MMRTLFSTAILIFLFTACSITHEKTRILKVYPGKEAAFTDKVSGITFGISRVEEPEVNKFTLTGTISRPDSLPESFVDLEYASGTAWDVKNDEYTKYILAIHGIRKNPAGVYEVTVVVTEVFLN